MRGLRGFVFAAVAVSLLGSTTCQAQSTTLLTHHVREVTANGQAKFVGRLSRTQSLRLVLILPLRNQAELDELLNALYDPSSASYRQFLTVDQFTARFGPTEEEYNALIDFAKANGLAVVGTSRNRLNLDVSGSVASIEQALHLTMGLYQHPTESRFFYAPDREPTPDLAVQLWHIAGLDNYSIPHPAGLHRNPGVKRNATTGSGPSASFLGSDMRAAYYGGSALNGSGQSLGLLEYYGTDLTDLNTYFANAGQTNHVPITLVSTDGTSTSCVYPSCDDTEQTLDMTQALGMAPGLASLVMYVGSSDAAIFNAMATATPLNAQLSSSWTWRPADPGTDNPYFEEFAAQGQNLFQAAGDNGKWGLLSEIYPSDDVYVTSVGGTDLDTQSAGGAWSSESAWSDGGGGVSPDFFAIPSWQTKAASTCSNCSKSYRNGPDVSANANFTFYVCADQTACTANEYGGTSFAAPMWAGYLALVNQQSVSNGNKTVGFINPTLYSIGGGSSYDSDFHDVISGSNGYPASTGYDVATGWGSPNGTGLIAALAGGSSSSPGFSLSPSPALLSVAQGSAGKSTITSAVTGGFASPITLSVLGNPPAGVTVTFGTNPINSNGMESSAMTMTVASSAVPGTYAITVQGSSGGTTETTVVSLTVTGVSPNFTISSSPTTVSVARGSSVSSTITTTVSGGFNSAIGLSVSGQGSNVTVTFSPSSIAAPGSGTATVTIKPGSRARLGNRTITITGTGGGVTHTTSVTFDVLN
jgi:subtilase family serine protease